MTASSFVGSASQSVSLKRRILPQQAAVLAARPVTQLNDLLHQAVIDRVAYKTTSKP
jgi:hypothetical protein